MLLPHTAASCRCLAQVTKRVLGATAIVSTGCVLLVSFGNHESPTLSSHDMLELYKKWVAHAGGSVQLAGMRWPVVRQQVPWARRAQLLPLWGFQARWDAAVRACMRRASAHVAPRHTL